MDRNDIADRLRALRRSLEAPFSTAKAANDQAEMARLTAIAGDIDDLLAEIILVQMETLVVSLSEIKARIDGHTAAAKAEAVSFGTRSVSKLEAEVEKILAESEEEVATAMPTTPSAAAAVAPLTHVTATMAAPASPTTGALILTEAHLIALWKRSQFPIDGRGIILFGLRGARPGDVDGTGVASQHEIVLTPVNYQSMNCTLGQWRPGAGLALFPGSTVPFGATVQAKIAANGVGVNQMGRGRYKQYDAGWHKRSEGPSGHWALLQGCQITLQRTGDDSDFDLADRWEVGWKAGDNIHCAFHMGRDGDAPNARFSSAGCQTVAGTVKKGARGSEAGPWAEFIAPFLDKLGSQKSAEYVLFSAEEAQQMIRTRCAGKTVVLRYGSAGPLVEDLQAALNAKAGAGLPVDGDFAASTFRAVVDFQTLTFGEAADDGIVGPQVASALGINLPEFDFDDAISGGVGHKGPQRVAAVARDVVVAVPAFGTIGAVAQNEALVWGKVTLSKHGPDFNTKVIAIANRLMCDPNNLMAVMAFETGGSFDPAQENFAGSSAIGLIQFMPATAKGLGTTSAKLAAMTGLEQLDFVEKHITGVSRGRPLPQLSDLYMCVLLPAAVGKPDSHVLFKKPSKAYDQNKGLDSSGDGRITKLEATAKVQKKKEQGRETSRFG